MLNKLFAMFPQPAMAFEKHYIKSDYLYFGGLITLIQILP